MDDKLQLLVFQLEQRLIGVHLRQIQSVIRAVDCTPLPEAPGIVRGIIDYHGEILPVLDIRKRFGIPHRETEINDHFIIATASGQRVALAVEAIKGVIERPAGDLIEPKAFFSGDELVEGVIQLEDGLALIHDLDKFLSLEESGTLQEALTRQSTHGA